MVDFPKLGRSFRFAFAGLVYVVRNEQNMRIHLAISTAVILAGWYFRISQFEWIAVVLCMGAVLGAEAVNSAIERLADRVTGDQDSLIRIAKDAAAGGVLTLAVASFVIGAIIFLPRILGLLQSLG
ncbi:MAG: diacylglycerol kinase family protein [Verrucomicrobiota bacterium]